MDQNRSQSYKNALGQFIVMWGEMASAWGVNRTMAQIHALLYAETNPLDTDYIMEQLDISRGNANMNLRNLVQWKLAYKVRLEGERKDYYTADKDVWSIVSKIIRERRQREVAPIHAHLVECLDSFASRQETEMDEEEKEFKKRLENFVEFLELFERFIAAMLPYINKSSLKFLKQLVKLAEMKEDITERFSNLSSTPSENE